MARLSSRERRLLAAVCDTLVPRCEPGEASGELDPQLARCAAADLAVADDLEAALAASASAAEIRAFRWGLRLLESRWTAAVLGFGARKFTDLAPAARTKLLLAWADGPFPFARRLFQAIKRPAMFLFYTAAPDGSTNPTWPALGYSGISKGGARPTDSAAAKSAAAAPTGRNAIAASRGPAAPWHPDALAAEVLVVGSGAGGGVVAATLAAAGRDVLVVEKGKHFADADFPATERAGFFDLFERRGALTTADGAVVVLAGSVVGGGTTVNWMTSLDPPPSVLDQWRREFGFRDAASNAFRECLEEVKTRLSVGTAESPANPPNAILERGCRALGYRVTTIPRNAQGCLDRGDGIDCGNCTFGCRGGAKKDMRNTFLADARDRGARLWPDAHVDRILVQGGAVAGAVLNVGRESVTVRAKMVVLAAGAIHTPAVLLRSGLAGPHVGANLRLHPTTAVCAEYAEPVRSWRGPPQTRYCPEFADLDGRGYGVRIEVSPAHPGLWGLALTWRSGAEHKRLMGRLSRLGNLIVICRDRGAGRVTVDRGGRPVLRYRLARHDAAHLMRGTQHALRIQHAAGALRLFSPHQRNISWSVDSHEPIERYLERVAAAGVRSNDFGLFSAHQLGSCRVAADRRQGAVSPEGTLYGVRNLFVADGSLMPTACGVNPMLTIAALARWVGRNLVG